MSTTTPPYATSRRTESAGRNPLARLYRGQTQFDFVNRWRYWFALSGTIIVVGMVALGARGLNLSIDFRGGTVWEVPTNLAPPGTATVAAVRADLGKISPSLSQGTVTQLTDRQTGQVNIQVQEPATKTNDPVLINDVTSALAKVGHVSVDDVTLNAIGPSWGSDITNKAIEAVVVFVVLLFIAISIYFETKMAIAAFVALVHDMLVAVGIYALSGFQVSPDTVIAWLTVLGYSLYDTIVVFDKVKENTRGLASTNRVTYTDVVNLSMNQVLARSINTSFVAIMPVLCILVIGSWILGASALNDFGLALFIGLTSGAYSSIFIASPLLALLKEREPRYAEIRKRLAMYPNARQVLVPTGLASSPALAGVGAGQVASTAGGGKASAGPRSKLSGASRRYADDNGGWSTSGPSANEAEAGPIAPGASKPEGGPQVSTASRTEDGPQVLAASEAEGGPAPTAAGNVGGASRVVMGGTGPDDGAVLAGGATGEGDVPGAVARVGAVSAVRTEGLGGGAAAGAGGARPGAAKGTTSSSGGASSTSSGGRRKAAPRPRRKVPRHR
ncbi:MAG: protein translocase subunit SecF [Acidimicrobiales bacterium]